MKRCLAYGMFPGFFSHNASEGHYFTRPELYDRDRPLFKQYVPLCKRVAEAGWEPITRARSDDEHVYVERFGSRYLDRLQRQPPAADGNHHLDEYADGAGPRTDFRPGNPVAGPHDDPRAGGRRRGGDRDDGKPRKVAQMVGLASLDHTLQMQAVGRADGTMRNTLVDSHQLPTSSSSRCGPGDCGGRWPHRRRGTIRSSGPISTCGRVPWRCCRCASSC